MKDNSFRIFVVPQDGARILVSEQDMAVIDITDDASLKAVYPHAFAVTVELNKPSMRSIQQIRQAATVFDEKIGFRIDESLMPQKRAAVLVKAWSGIPGDPQATEDGFLSLDADLGGMIDAHLASRLMPMVATNAFFSQALSRRQELSAKAEDSTQTASTKESENTAIG